MQKGAHQMEVQKRQKMAHQMEVHEMQKGPRKKTQVGMTHPSLVAREVRAMARARRSPEMCRVQLVAAYQKLGKAGRIGSAARIMLTVARRQVNAV